MQNDVYDYTNPAAGVQRSSVLRKTYGLLALSFIPCALGAFAAAAANFNIYAATGSRWMGFAIVLLFFYGMVFLIEKNRYSNTGAGLLMVFTFGMGGLISPLLQYGLGIPGGAGLVATAALMTASIFGIMSFAAHKANINTQSLTYFLTIGAVVLIIGMIANFFLNVPMFGLAVSGAFAIFSSLIIMWQTRVVIEGGEDSHISAALSIFIAIYNLFSSLLHILLSLAGSDE
ncbi:Bax inhibitor-1 family protein [Kingella potus]|uniref:Bax inhibitor-1 family protein n=1 Tax=Kingella potus TaxID=265175 RepID=UPI001FD4D91E|nr:Bax inhibitor-1 family protein [Kingella potus]UOP00469.1 Bax inhibitor-1 family protein [Kingella potus]